MKSALRVSIASMLVLGLLICLSGSFAYAQLFPSCYSSGIQVCNLEDVDAVITITGYKDDGTAEEAFQEIIPKNSCKTYTGTRNPLPVSNDFSGPIVISSDKQTVAIANIVNCDRNAYASYISRSSGSTNVSLPLLTNALGGFTTWYSVQNAGSSPANVNVSYSDGQTASATIPVGSAKVFYQAQEGHADGSAFAATITSDQPVVAAVIQESTKMIFAYTGFTAGTPNPVFPLVNQNNNGYRTGLQVQNIGDQATDVTLEYVPSKFGTYCEETISIAPGTSATFALRTFQGKSSPGTSTCIQERFVGSAKVKTNSTDQPLVGIGNQLKPGINGEAYGSFDADSATNTVVMPLIMDRRGGFNTGIAVQHVDGPASDVSCTFSDSSYTINQSLAVGGSFTEGQRNQIADGYAGSGVCTAANADTKIVAVVNQVKASDSQDLFLVYEGAAVSN